MTVTLMKTSTKNIPSPNFFCHNIILPSIETSLSCLVLLLKCMLLSVYCTFIGLGSFLYFALSLFFL